MRTLLIYGLALGAVAVALIFGLPHVLEGDAAARGPGRGKDATVPVVAAVVRRAPLQDSLEALGTVYANESVRITANRADHVTALHFEDGQSVKAGELLLEMSSDEEKAELAEATALLTEQRLNHQRNKELFDSELSSGREYETSKALLATAEARVRRIEAAISDRQLRAPFAGVLGLRQVSVGAFVQPGTLVTTLDDIATVKVDFTIPETWLAQVSVGMPIVARSDAFVGADFRGQITTIAPRVDPVTRSATLRARIPNPQLKLRPGMLLKLDIQRDDRAVLQIPEEALIPVGKENFVLRVEEDRTTQRISVRIGRRTVGSVEVLEGLEAGEHVIVEGLLRVQPGTRVEIVKERQP